MAGRGQAQKQDIRHHPRSLKAKELYIAAEDWNMAWLPEEIETVKKEWEAGEPIDIIAEKVDRYTNEVALLIMDLDQKNKVKARKGGAWGSKKEV